MKIFIDTETGGINPNKHSLLSIGLVKIDNDNNIVDTKEWFVATEDEYVVTPKALSINQINLLEHSEISTPKYQVCDEIIEFIDCPLDDTIQLCGQNVNFDKMFLKHLFDNHSTYSFEKYFSYRNIDISSIASYLCDLGLLPHGTISLDKLMQRFGLTNERHNALSDAIVTLDVYKQLLNLIKDDCNKKKL